jgi:hypothetical protein
MTLDDLMYEKRARQRIILTHECSTHVPENNVRDLDIIQREQVTEIKECILLHINLDGWFRSQNVINDSEEKIVKSKETGDIEGLIDDILLIKSLTVGICIFLGYH